MNAPHPLPLRVHADRRPHLATPGRPLAQCRHIQVAIERECERTRDRRRGEEQDVGRRALGDEGGALLHAEPVLLVDHHQAELPERDRLLQQRMRAENDACRTGRDALARRCLLCGAHPAEQHLRHDAEGCEQARQRGRVLFREQLGRGHERRLMSVLERHQHREQRHDRLARADITHEQPVHPLRERHVGVDLARAPFPGRP